MTNEITRMLEVYLPGYSVEFKPNPHKTSVYWKESKILIDPFYAHCNFVVLLYMCYTTLMVRKYDYDYCKSDKMAIEQLKNEGHKIDKQFYLDVFTILSTRNEMRKQMFYEIASGEDSKVYNSRYKKGDEQIGG